MPRNLPRLVNYEQTNARQICFTKSYRYIGFVDCDPSKPTSSYTGYEVAAFRAIAAELGWLEVPTQSAQSPENVTSFYFKCTDLGQPDLINVLTANVSSAKMYPEYPCTIAGGM